VLPKYLNAKDELTDAPIKGRHKGPEDVDKYEIVDGHRRYVVLERLHEATAMCLVFPDAAEAKYAMMLHANVCREDVTTFEEGVQFLELATKYQWSMDQLMQFFQQSEDYINDRVDIVRKDNAVAEAVRDRRIGLGQAKEVLKAADIATRQILLEQAAVHGATILALREMRHSLARDAAAAQGTLPMNSPAYAEPAAIINPDTCCFCGEVGEQYQLVTIRVHQYELSDLKAVLDKFSRRALMEQIKGQQ
jgi:ParB-like chromosome segregation protein Spo0J